LAVTTSALPAQTFQPLLDADRRDLIHEALSGEIAKDHVIQITRHHRIQGSRGYRHAAEYVLEQLRAYGLGEEEAYIESFPSDGRIEYQTWQSPSGWDIESAELRLVEPFDERIVGYPEIAMSLITYSNPGDATAELIWVGSGTQASDYEGKDVAGKFVLATGYGGEVHRHAVIQHGAVGVVCYLDDDRAAEHPDMLAYTGMWPLAEELDHVTFGFNLTNRQGERLRGMLESGERVVVRGHVEGIGLEPYYMDVPVALIKGSERPEEELVIAAHLDHPKESANDNASGSAAMLDIARALKMLIDEGRMPQPKRSIRFLWVPEWNGTMAYIDEHPEMVGPQLGGGYLAHINLDMVGEHLELLHTRMGITRTPASIPSALNDVVENMAQMVDRMTVRTPRGSQSAFNYRVTAYGGGSDHMMFIDRKIPGMMIGHGDYTHHTSEDTPDKVDPVEIERSEIITAGAFLYLSDLSEAEAIDLAYLVAANGAQRLVAAARRARTLTEPDALNAMQHAGHWEQQALESVLTFHDSPETRATIERFSGQLETQADALADELADGPSRVQTGDDRVPVRLTRGPLDFGLPETKLPESTTAWYRAEGRVLNGTVRFELVNFVDGTRTISEIRDAVSAEFSPIPTEVVAKFFEDLVQVGVMEWR
jgi:hypothetical protein